MLAALLLALLPVTGSAPPDTTIHCDVIVAGGTTAALAAALHAAREGAETCLTEPTDWVGGQLTSEGVSAVDFAWHRVDSLDVGALHRDPANLPPEWSAWFRDLGQPGALLGIGELLRAALHPAAPPLARDRARAAPARVLRDGAGRRGAPGQLTDGVAGRAALPAHRARLHAAALRRHQ